MITRDKKLIITDSFGSIMFLPVKIYVNCFSIS